MKPLISLVSGTYNEEGNVNSLYERICEVIASLLDDYEFEIIVIDNASEDGTVDILKELASRDRRLKLIINNRNFGHIRSPYHAILQAQGDAVIYLASDLQDPPEMITDLIKEWRSGYKVVLAQKEESEESPLFFMLRSLYYKLVNGVSSVRLHENVTGFGLYDREVIEVIKQINDPYPFFRGLIAELGYHCKLLPFSQPLRRRGISKNNLYTLWDIGMLGLTSHSKVPLRIACFLGLGVSLFSFIIAFVYLLYKILFWESFQLGAAPVVIGIFFIGAIQLFFLGILGEYIGAIHTQALNRPSVIERERINF